MSTREAFAPLRTALEQAGVRYAVGGSWASTAFGEPRFTDNVNILAAFTLESVPRFLAALPETFYADPDEAVNLLAKLHWFREGGEVSEVQWRDILGILRGRRASLDREYLARGAQKLGITALLERAFGSVP